MLTDCQNQLLARPLYASFARMSKSADHTARDFGITYIPATGSHESHNHMLQERRNKGKKTNKEYQLALRLRRRLQLALSE